MMWTNILIGLMAFGLLVAAWRALSSPFERMVFAALGVAGLVFVSWAQITGFTIPPVEWTPNWTVLAAALTVALLGAGVGTGSPRWAALGVMSSAWFAWTLFGFNTAALLLFALGTVLMLANSHPRVSHHWFALGAMMALFSGTLVAANGIHDMASWSDMRKYVVQQDQDTNQRIGNLAKAQSVKDTVQDARIAALEAHDKIQDKRLDVLEQKVSGIQSVKLADDVDRQSYYDKMARQLQDAHWKPGDFVLGTVNWDRNGYDAGARRFVPNRLDSQQKLAAFLNGSSAQSKAARAHVVATLPPSEHDRALSGRGFVPIQFTKDVCLTGNTYFLDARAVRDGERCHGAGDIVWVYVGRDGTVYWDASVRADCGNPGMTTPPHPQGTQPSQPATVSTPAPTTATVSHTPPTETSTTTVTPSTSTTTQTSTTTAPPSTTTTTVTTTAPPTTTTTTVTPTTPPPSTTSCAGKTCQTPPPPPTDYPTDPPSSPTTNPEETPPAP